MRKRILFIMHMPPPVHGASMVGKYIHDSELINSEFECYFLNPTTAKNIEDVNKFRLGKAIDIYKLIQRIKAKVREIQPDLVYFTANSAGFAFYKDYLIIRTLKSLGCKIIVHYHNKGVASKQNRFIDNRLYKSFFKDIKVMLLSESLYTDVKKYVCKEDVVFCGNGIPDNTGAINIHNEISSNNHLPLKMLFLSNMMTAKGVMTLLEACRELKKRGVSFHCDFVGAWKDISQESFEKCINGYNLTNNVKAHGPKYGNEKNPYYREADVMVFPTHNDCFPLVLLEGEMHGLACISTNEGGIPGIIDDNRTGIIVPKKNITALADAIERLANDRALCKTMGMNGRKKYEEQFTLSAFENRFVNCLNEVLSL